MKTRTLAIGFLVVLFPLLSVAQTQEGTTSESEKNQTASGLENSLKEISQQLGTLGEQYSGLTHQIAGLKEQITDLDRRLGEVEKKKVDSRKGGPKGNADRTPQGAGVSDKGTADRYSRDRIEKQLEEIAKQLGAISGRMGTPDGTRAREQLVEPAKVNADSGKEAVAGCCEKIEKHLELISRHLATISEKVGNEKPVKPVEQVERRGTGWVRVINFTRRDQLIFINDLGRWVPASSEATFSVPVGTFSYRLSHETRRTKTISTPGEEQRVKITQPETLIWDAFLGGYVRVGD